jgi:DNA-binding transcriptional MerR regulator
MLGSDIVQLKRRASVDSDDSEALRRDWLLALAFGSPLRRLLDLIGRYLDRGFSIPEIDAYIDERLTSARGRLRQVRRDGSMTATRLQLLERTIESAAAERSRSKGDHNPMLAHALAMTAELEESRTH